MTEPAFTPGPWEACDPGDYGDFDGDSRVVLGNDMRIAVVHWHDGDYRAENDANAHLIAAAPDLYAALEDALALVSGEISGTSQAAGIVTEAKAALAKARGGDNETAADCPTCEDRELYPQYGVAPHDCYWRKGPQFTIGQSTLRPISPDECFVPDMDETAGWSEFVYPSACGVYYCPACQRDEYQQAWDRLVAEFGQPPASVTGTGTAETLQAAQGEACQNGPQGDAQNTPQVSDNEL